MFPTLKTNVTTRSRAAQNKQSKIPVLKTQRMLVKQTSLELEKKENDDKHDIFSLEELLCDIQETIEKKHPTNFMLEMKEIIAAKDQLYVQLDNMKAEQRILQENHEQERNNLLQEICDLKHKLEESNGFADEITLKLEEESYKVRCLDVELGKSKVDTDLIKAKLEDTEVGLEELAKENQSLQLELEQMSGLTWVKDVSVSNCQDCQTKFTVRLRKHHCRKCGGIFCGSCSARQHLLPAFKKPQRVCSSCFSLLSSTGSRAS